MAAPVYVDAGTGATDAGGAWSYTCQASAAAGRIFIVQILQDGTTTGAVTSIVGTNIKNLAGTDNVWTAVAVEQAVGSATAALQSIYIGRALSTAAPTISGANSTSEDLYIRSYQFSDVSAGTTLDAVIENATAGSTVNGAGTSGTIADAGVTTLGSDRLALNFIAISDDNAIASFTGETGGDWTEAVAEYAESSGTDGSIGLQLGYSATHPTAGAGMALNGTGGTGEKIAQSFSAPATGTLSGVLIGNWTKTGTPSDNLLVEIQTDSSGSPSGTTVGTGGSIAASSVPTTGWCSVGLSASLTGSTTYWIVLSRSGSRDTGNCLQPAYLNPGAYSGGSMKSLDSGSWSDYGGAYDLQFALPLYAAGTIDGGTTANADATDGWGVVGFALIGTTVEETRVPARNTQYVQLLAH